jgi:hypothetical protein
VRIARVAATLVLALAAACSGEGKTGTFAVPTRTPASVPSQVPARTVAPGRLRPPAPARLFAGTASNLGQLTHYCKNSICEEADPQTPVFLVVPSGASFVLFTIGETPLEARAEVRVRPSERPATVKLEPGTLMVFNHGLGEGRYLVDLFVRWRSSEARWRFGMNLRGG